MRLRSIGVAALLCAFGAIGTASAQTQFPAALELETLTAPHLEASATTAAATVKGAEEHQFGVGLRLGGYLFGAGGSLRYFFAGPLGVQVEFIHYGGVLSYSYNEVQGAIVYRLRDITPDYPIVLTPYLGGGVSSTSFGGFRENGGIILGGVEAFFDQLPRAGISVQVLFNTADISGLGSAGATLGAHWYFK